METFGFQDVAEKIMKKIKEERANLKKLNIMVFGKTGVGKSTLINNVFSEKMAETGVGKPVTDTIRKYEKDYFPLVIYDSPGLELSGENAVDALLKDAFKLIKEGLESNDIGKAIHCIWYCVSSSSHRFEDTEIEFISKFLKETTQYEIPVIVVLTQSFSKKDSEDLKKVIEKENLNVAGIVPVLAEDYVISDEYTAKAFGLDRLVELVNEVIPEAVQNTLVAVQKANLKMKANKSHIVVATAAAGAAATCFIPIPFSDAVMLVPEQIAMIAKITTIYGLPVDKATISGVVSATLGTAGATVLGKNVVSAILKLIPGAGSVAGGVISGSVAAAITAALGEAYIAVMGMVSRGEMNISDISTEKGKATISSIFKEKLKLARNDTGMVVEKKPKQKPKLLGKVKKKKD